MQHASIKSVQSEQSLLRKWLTPFAVLFVIGLLLAFAATTVVISGHVAHATSASVAVQSRYPQGNQANQGGGNQVNQANQGGWGGRDGFGGNQSNQG